MVITFVKELTGRTKVRFPGESKEADFQQIRSQADSFNAFMERLGSDGLPDLGSLPPHPAIANMMTLLYKDAIAETPGLFSITNFPTSLCPTGARFDVTMRRALCVTAFASVEQEDEDAPALNHTDSFLAPLDGAAEAARMQSSMVVFEGVTGKIVLDTRSIAAVLAPHSTAPVEQVLPTQWRHKSFSLQEAGEVLGMVYKSLIAFWETNTHTDKVKVNAMSLMAIVAGDVRDYCKEQITLESSDLHGPWRMPKQLIEKVLETCRLWQQYCRQLVETDWKDWDGGHFHDESFDAFIKRLRDVSTIRNLVECTATLTTVPFEMQPEQIFESCSLVDATRTPQSTWDAAVAAFEHEFSLVEDMLRGSVRKRIENSSGDAQIRVVQQYAPLVRRPAIMSALGQELETVAAHLMNKLDAAKQRFLKTSSTITGSGGVFEVQRIRVAKACLTSCGPIVERGRSVFGHSSPLQRRVEEAALGIVKLTATEENKALDSWKQSIETRCSRINSLDRAVVIAAEGSDFLTCAVNPEVNELVTEYKSVQSIATAGSAVLGNNAERTLQTCEKLLQTAIRTQQLVAAFNNLQRQVLPPCRDMMESLNQQCISQICSGGAKQRIIPFSNYSELDALNQRFYSSLETLSNQNRHIRRFHNDFATQVIDLHNVDLLRSMDQWRAIADGMRTTFDTFIKTQQLKNHDRWRRHWDAQLYKALECQYRKGLENLHENMQEFKVELVFKQGQVQFRPSFEAMREAYYVKVREFVSLPQRFRGMQAKREAGDATPYEYFPLMPAANAERITTVHIKAMELFQKLNKVRKAFRDYVAAGVCGTNGAPDLDSVVDLVVTELPHWVDGFKLVRDRMKKTSTIEEAIRVDCFTVSTTPMKAAIEGQLRKLEDSLVHSLRKAMQKRLGQIDDFVLFASNIIERQPTTLDEVGRANKAFHQFKEELPLFEAKFKEIDDMNKILRTVSGASMEMNLTRSRWEHLMDAMSSHHKIIEASVSKMRVSIDSMIAKHFKDVERFAKAWDSKKPTSLKAFKNRQEFIDKGLNYVKEQVQLLNELVAASREIEAKCDYFKIVAPELTQLDSVQRDIDTHHAMWLLYERFESALDKLRSEDWLTFRSHTYLFDDFVKEWRELTEHQLSTAVGGDKNIVLGYLNKLIDEWQAAVPLLKFVRGEGMMSEHWGEMFRLLEMEKGMTSDKLTFGDILNKHTQLVAKEKEIKHLHSRAQGEIQIRDALQDLRTWALEATFTLVLPQDSTNKVQLITEWKDIMTQVSDNQALLGSLKDSPYFPRFADEAQGWEAKLLLVSEYLVLLNNIQRKWTYLEPLFARGALPNEQPRFKRVDKEFVGVLREIETDPRIMSLAVHTDYSEKLKSIQEQMERCQKALNEFLEQKRDKFPRFYFISDEDLLEILGQSKNPAVIQAHLKKLFMGINTVLFNDKHTTITHMVSSDGEQVQIKQEVGITDNNVEDWLIRLDGAMRDTLKESLRQCLSRQDATKSEVVAAYPSQILQVAEQIFFAQMVEKAIPVNDLNNVLATQKQKLQALTSVSYNGNVVTELKLKALILDVIHNIEVVELLLEKKTRNAADWWWQKQLRYYADNEKGCVLRMVDTCFAYTYEYQGNAAKLVHTPLTDKCYLVLTKGMDLGYGGNPYGPAGTGKTESVKALGSAMGRQVLVFNCDEGIDFKAMGRIFVGIVKCGAWGCFDEFNRLKVDQLSAISQMIQVIQEALKNNEPSCTLLSRLIDVNPNSGIFVTLNPAGKGYGGRSKLPDNLKQLFREVAMSVPDNELITATMLLSEGFTHAKSISKKVVEVYKLSKQLMSQQQHYDWGLRPLKAVLRLGGSLVQQWRRDNKGGAATEQQECELMVQSLRINTLSKLTFEYNTLSKLTFDDARLFNGIIGDIFPGTAIREISYKELEAAIHSSVDVLGLQHSPVQLHKTLQLYEAMNQRMGVVLVGPSGSGKSTLLKILRKALQTLGVEVPQHTMNPKALPRQQLLGYMDPDTREWYDGVLSAAARRVVKEPAAVKSWIFCDGDIDPEWVESLNSVLDDNKLLTMPNGVRIQFGNNVNFVFETHSLEFASPATVSRMGIIFLSEQDVDLTFHIKAFMALQEADVRARIGAWVEQYVPRAVAMANDSGALVVPTTPMGLLNAALNHVVDSINEMDFATSLARGLAATMLPKSHAEFANKVLELTKQRPVNPQRPLATYVNRNDGQTREFSARGTGALRGASADVLRQREKPVVPTAETEKLEATLAPLMKHSQPFLLVGPEGAGKSMTLSSCFAAESSSRVSVIHCSAQTSAQHLIQKLTQLCSAYSTNAGKVLRPKEGDKLVLVLKDLNLPKPDKYGTVQLHSFLQQLLLYRGFYDNELEWVGIERVQIAASMNPEVSAGRYPVSPRLLAIMNIVYVDYPTKESLQLVYASYFSVVLKAPQFAEGPDYEGGAQLANFALTVFDKIKRRFEGEEHAHCVICPRDIISMITNCLSYAPECSSIPALLAYEASRLFSDRLSRPDDRSRAEKIFVEQLATIGFAVNKDDRDKFAYVSWSSDWNPVTGGRQLALKSYEDLEKEVKNGVMRYGREVRDLNIPLIPESVQWVARMDRVLSKPGGHLLLVGRSGVGRRAAATVAAYLIRMEVVMLNMTRDYSIKSFRNDLRSVLQRVGSQNERIMLLVEDHNFIQETFLEMINSLVSSGEVPGLFSPEEMDSMLAPLREEASNEGFMGNISSYFVRRVFHNLRVCIIMDPRNELFRSRCQANPGLLTCCSVQWLGTWSSDGTRSICKQNLQDVIKQLDGTEAGKGFALHREMYSIHDSLGAQATPLLFQTFMETYRKIYTAKDKASASGLERLEVGLTKLLEAEANVSKIREDVGAKKVEMERMQIEADSALTEIQKSMEDSKEQRDNAEELTVRLAQSQEGKGRIRAQWYSAHP
ncbi:Hypothetical protein, putative [Bodo saltans]|uniref:Cytoplasmic dynein 2 heavy chain 1 n=1 Tax=Bodo saltans TaxID=75058 RepID=A0A0S4IZG5_BODSA|nr:Hypothetical protein, putative [Bodo saltans]|eukprot:CUG03846.1 Hypothetical protein, putative [Bodo saltans]